jgi:hypothetical protein
MNLDLLLEDEDEDVQEMAVRTLLEAIDPPQAYIDSLQGT